MRKLFFTLAIILTSLVVSYAQQGDALIQVLWNGDWYEAEVLKIQDDKWYIHYVGYGDEWDEWVSKDRIRLNHQVGDKVLVEWDGKWWEATIMKIKGDKYYIHYDGWEDSWDEWVTHHRIKLRP